MVTRSIKRYDSKMIQLNVAEWRGSIWINVCGVRMSYLRKFYNRQFEIRDNITTFETAFNRSYINPVNRW